MLKKSNIVPVRFTDGLLDAIAKAVRRSPDGRVMPYESVSDFIRKACEEKLAHLARCKKSNAQRRVRPK